MVSVSWVMNGYNLVLTVLFLPMGRLGDRYGHKLVFTLGLAVFTAASLPCALAGSVPELVAWRVVQAVGAAGVVPTALALLLQAFPERRQGFAAGLFGAVSSLALAVGPVLGGVLVWYRGWPAVFWLNLPVGILGVILVLTLTRGLRTPRTRASLDWPGVGLVSAGLFCVTLAMIQGNDWGWTWRASLVSSPAAAPFSSSGRGGSSAPPLPVRPAAVPRPHLRRVRHRRHDRRHRDDGHDVHEHDLHDRDDGLQRAQGRPRDRRATCRRHDPDAARRLARGPRGPSLAGGDRRPGDHHRARRPGAPRAHRARRRRRLAKRPRRRRHRPLAAGAARRRHERRSPAATRAPVRGC